MEYGKDVAIYAPASIGNVSVGFDVLGAAVSPVNGERLGDRVFITMGKEPFRLNTTGKFVDKLPKEPQQNIVFDCWQVFSREMDKRGKEILPVELTLEKNMPIGSGLGSSACSIVAALDALNQFHAQALDETTLLKLMGEMEGKISGSVHYDNVAPCYLGGVQLMVEERGIISQSVPSFKQWYWVMAFPGIKVSTAEARDILPSQYRRQDIIAHGRHLAGFIHACHTNQSELAADMIKDVIAEPYRERLLPGFAQAREYAKKAGALATGISGSGPTLFSICDDLDVANRVAVWLEKNYVKNAEGFVHVCQLNEQGSMRTGSEL